MYPARPRKRPRVNVARAALAALAFMAAGAAGGCSRSPPPSAPEPPPESPYKSRKPDRPATTVDQVKLYPWYELPDGIIPRQRAIGTAKSFPTAEDPHAVLGYFKIPSAVTDAEEGRRLAIEAAAQHGGNGVVFLQDDPKVAAVLYVSAADPGYPAPEALFEALEKSEVPGEFKPGKAVTRSLEELKPVEVSLKRNQCYGLAWAFTASVQVDLRSVFFGWFVESRRPSEASPVWKQVFHRIDKEGHIGRARFKQIDCVRQDTVVSLTLTPDSPRTTGPGRRMVASDVKSWASHSSDRPVNLGLGKGEIALRPYVFSVPEAMRQQACAKCITGLNEYSADCLERLHLSLSICK